MKHFLLEFQFKFKVPFIIVRTGNILIKGVVGLYWRHVGLVVSTIASQQEGHGFDPQLQQLVSGNLHCPVMIASLRSQYFLHGNVKIKYRSSGDCCVNSVLGSEDV